MDNTQFTKTLKDIGYTLESIDSSLQELANSDKKLTAAFVSKRTICTRLNVPSVTLDKLIHQGVVSGGDSGLVEGVHFCRVDPNERNSSKFLYDPRRILDSAWKSFKNV